MTDGNELPPVLGDGLVRGPLASSGDREACVPGIESNVRDLIQQDTTQRNAAQNSEADAVFTQLDLAEENFLVALRGRFETCDEGELSRQQVNDLLREVNQRPSNLRLVSSTQRSGRSAGREPSSFDTKSDPYEDWATRRGGRGLTMRRALIAALVVGSGFAGIVGLELGGFDVFGWSEEGLSESAEAQPDSSGSPAMRTRSELVLSSGTVTVDGLAVVFGRDPLEVGQRIATTKGRACLTADPNVEVCLDEGTEVQIVSLVPDDIRFDVLRGAAVAQLSPLPPGHAFSLTAGPVRAEAIGTVFEVSHDPANARAQVTVLAGKVGVSVLSHDAVQVPAHNRMAVDLSAAKAMDMETVGRVEESPIWSQLAMSEWWRPAEVGIAEIVPIGEVSVDGSGGGDVATLSVSKLGVDGQSSAGQTAFVRIDGGPSLALPIRTLLPLGQHRVVMIDATGVERSVEFEVRGGESRRVELPISPTEKPTLATGVQGGVVRTASDLLRAARELRQQRNPAAALRAYSELRSRYPTSSEAHTVLVTMGKLQLELGRPSEALSSFDRYLRSSGPLGPEALAGKVSALRAQGQTSKERAAIEEYLRRYPDGFLAPRLQQRLEALR